MRVRGLLLVSLFLNLVLLTWWQRLAPAAKAARPISWKPATTSTAPPPQPVQPLPTGPKWSEVFSEDLKVYRDQLRGIGCPQETVADILRGEVEARYEIKAREASPTMPFWINNFELCRLKGGERERLRKLEAEKQALYRELLGAEWDEAGYRQWLGSTREALRLGFLPVERAMKLDGAFHRLDVLRFKLKDETREILLEEDEQELAVAVAAVQQVLDPIEMDEFRLRLFEGLELGSSMSKPIGVDLREDEYRELVRILADGINPMDFFLSLPQQTAFFRKSEANVTNSVNRIRALIGEERYPQYLRSKDGLLKSTFFAMETTPENTADPVKMTETAIQAFDLKETALQELEAIASTRRLSGAEKQQQSDFAESSFKQALTNLVGEAIIKKVESTEGELGSYLKRP